MSDQTINNSDPIERQAKMKSDFAKVGQFKYVMNSALGWLSAFFCAVCLLYLSLFLQVPLLLLNLVVMTSGSGTEWFGVNPSLSFVIIVLPSSVSFFSSMIFGRFLLRAIPPRLSGERRKGVIILLALLTISYIASLLWYFFKGMDTTPSLLSVDAPITNAFQTFNNSTAFRTLQFLSLFFWWLGFIIPLAVRHVRPRYFLEKPFVLFLRRFSHFSDRTVQHASLKYTRAGKPVVFLTPTRSRAGDWDPFRVGFSGIKFWRPIHSMPVILRSTNEDWKQAAQELINHAQIIVLDISEGSGAIQSEIDMIHAIDRWHDVVLLAKEEKEGTNEAEQIVQFTARGATLITYKKSWIRALPRLFFGLPATLAVIVPLFYLLPGFVSMIVLLFVTGSRDLSASLPDSFGVLGSVLRWYIFVVNLVVYGWIYIIFFVRPALNKSATKALSKRLRLH